VSKKVNKKQQDVNELVEAVSVNEMINDVFSDFGNDAMIIDQPKEEAVAEVAVEETKTEKPVKAKKEPKAKKEKKVKVEKKEPKEKKVKVKKGPVPHEFITDPSSITDPSAREKVADLGTKPDRINEVALTDKQKLPSERWRLFVIKSNGIISLGVDERKTNHKKERVSCVYTTDVIDETGLPIFSDKDKKEIPNFVIQMAVKYINENKDLFEKAE
jgi:hypothetical protein